MPYIKQEDRERLLKNNDPKTEGELNYLLTLAYMEYIKEHGESYSNYGFIRTEIQLLTNYISSIELKNYDKPFVELDFYENFVKIINNFFDINDVSSKTRRMVIGALINSSDELYRRKIAPYEDKKIIENGDVY